MRLLRSTSSRKWRKLVWPLILATLCRQGFPIAKITEVFMLRLTELNDRNLSVANGVLDAGNAAFARDAVFADPWGHGGAYEHTLMIMGVRTTSGCYLASFVCRDYVDYELLRVVPVPAFEVGGFPGRQQIFPV